MVGYGDDSSTSNPDLATGDGPAQAALVAVSGPTLDIDLLIGNLAMNPSIDAPTLISMSVVKATPVYGLYDDGSKTDTVMSDSTGIYTVMVKENSQVRMVAAASGQVLNTLTEDETKVGTAPVTNNPTHVCTKNAYSAPSGVAVAAALSADMLADQGVCMFGTQDHFTPPFVKLTANMGVTADAGFDIYGMTNPMVQPPTFVKQNSSPIGIVGVTKTGLTASTDITLTATAASGTNTYASSKCTVKPGFVTFHPLDPSN